jgi:hypothetical protein
MEYLLDHIPRKYLEIFYVTKSLYLPDILNLSNALVSDLQEVAILTLPLDSS